MNNPHSKTKTSPIFGFALILGITVLLGLSGAIAYYSLIEPVFESEAQFRLTTKELNPSIVGLDFSSINDARHDCLIVQPNIVTMCFAINKLHKLSSFEGLKKTEISSLVDENIDATQDKDDPSVYKVIVRTKRPEDSQTIANNLIATYVRYLRQEQNNINSQHLTILKTVEEGYGFALSKEEVKDLHEVPLASWRKGAADLDARIALIEDTDFEQLIQLNVLEQANPGKQVSPILTGLLSYGAAAGFAVGMLFFVFWCVLKKLAAY